MPVFEIEKTEEYHPVNSHIKENGESNGSITVYSSKHKTTGLKPPLRLRFCVKHTPTFYVAFVSVIFNLILIIAVSSLVKPSPGLPTCPPAQMSEFCPHGWVGYQRKCYYFSTSEGNWTFSERHCSSLNASLAVVDSQEEMDFMMRYKTGADYWIGLQRNLNESWTWINGTIFSGWFTILGGGSCAYMNHHNIASSSCSSEDPWICSKEFLR